MKNSLLLTIVFCINCSGEILVCDTNLHGLCLQYEDTIYDSKDIKTTVDILQTELDKTYPKTPNIIKLFRNNNVTVQFHTKKMYKGCKQVVNSVYKCKGPISGLNVNGVENYILDQGYKCLANTAFIHELIHSIAVLHYDRGGHPFPFYCKNYPNCSKPFNSLNYRANEKAHKTLESCK